MDATADLSAETLQTMLNAGPDAQFEWLDERASEANIAASLSAMANTHGGTIVIGVKAEQRKFPRDLVKAREPGSAIVGVTDTQSVVDRVLKAALSLDPPLIIPLPRTLEFSSRKVIVVRIISGMPRVYALEGRYLKREGSINVGIKPPELRRLFIERGEISFETEPVYDASLNDLDWSRVRTYVERLGNIGKQDHTEILIKRGCLFKQADNKLVPTNAGLLLFGKEPQHFVRGAEITAARFAGTTMSDTFTRQDIGGTLPEQIERASTFLRDQMRKTVTLKDTMSRSDVYEYPLEAARELVVNAVAHRDYSISGDGIRLFLFQDRMDVTSPGTLPGPVTIDNIKDERFSRNPAIVQVLADMGFIERLGYGVDRVIELMKQLDQREPEFNETAGGFRARLFNQEIKTTKTPTSPVDPVAAILNSTDHNLNPRQEGALNYLRQPGNTRITNSELQRLFPDVHPETIRRDLADLVTKKVLQKRGQKRGSYYVLNETIAHNPPEQS